MSLRRLQGWEPATVYEHDDAGRVLRSRPEPEWTPYERGLMLALSSLRELTCSGCGGYLPETTSTDADDAMIAVHHSRCHHCVALDIRRDADRDKPHVHADRYTLIPRPAG